VHDVAQATGHRAWATFCTPTATQGPHPSSPPAAGDIVHRGRGDIATRPRGRRSAPPRLPHGSARRTWSGGTTSLAVYTRAPPRLSRKRLPDDHTRATSKASRSARPSPTSAVPGVAPRKGLELDAHGAGSRVAGRWPSHRRPVGAGLRFHQKARIVIEQVRAELDPVRQGERLARYVVTSLPEVPLQLFDQSLLSPISHFGARLEALLERLVGCLLDGRCAAERSVQARWCKAVGYVRDGNESGCAGDPLRPFAPRRTASIG